MYNSDFPQRADLPTTARLLRSTFVAFVAALAILVIAVLPAEYGIDATGLGRTLGLTQMGEIKVQLSREAAIDAQNSAAAQNTAEAQPEVSPVPEAVQRDEQRMQAIEERLDRIAALIESRSEERPADIDEENVEDRMAAVPATEQPPAEPQSEWRDEISITLAPGEGIEYKLVMAADAVAEFEWTANGSVLNYDTHGDGGGNSVSYEKGRGVEGDEGVLRAAFDGNHGWFWRNRTDSDVTLTLRTRGDYAELKRTV